MQRGLGGFPHERLHQDKAPLSYGNYRLWRRLAVGHAKGEREQTMSNWRGFPHSRFASRQGRLNQ
ncbi:hypothetical protein [Moorena bouillonii]|uniref:hypothetical protein n=1 Tax=Moorena bouillonii TaxID=207920 RepID=UPI0011816F6C|nr:hypothetical protein [Moorena bouillonii]